MKNRSKMILLGALIVASVAGLGFVSKNGHCLSGTCHFGCPVPNNLLCTNESPAPTFEYSDEVCTGDRTGGHCKINVSVYDCDTTTAPAVTGNYATDCLTTGLQCYYGRTSLP